MTNQKAFEKRKQIIIKIVVEKREKYGNDKDNNINNDIKNEYREKLEAKRK